MKKMSFFCLFSFLLINTSSAVPIERFSSSAQETILRPVLDKKNLSGLTYNPHTHSYYAIINKGDRIFEFDANFNLIKSITISGFSDPEDLCFIGMTDKGPEIAISGEEGTIWIGTLGASEQLRASSMRAISLKDENGKTLSYMNNKGIEGITYIPAENLFLVVQEKPTKVWSFQLKTDQKVAQLQPYVNASVEMTLKKYVDDLSAISFNTKTNEMVLLSDESSALVYINHKDRQVKKVIDLETQLQHEGLAFSHDFEKAYVASEPYYLLEVAPVNTRRTGSR
jgi:uncharacterized protein YjiK